MIQMNLEGIPCPLIRSVALIISLLLKLWCKGKNFYDKGQGINAEPLTRPMVSGSAYHGLLKLRHDVAFATSRRNNQCVATQQQIRRDVIPATSCPIK